MANPTKLFQREVVHDPREVKEALGLSEGVEEHLTPLAVDMSEEEIPEGIQITKDEVTPAREEKARTPRPRVTEKRVFAPDPEQEKLWDWLRRSAGQTVGVKISKRNIQTMRYEYLPGANFQFNPDVEDSNHIEEFVANKWKFGEYRMTFSPPRGSGLNAFTYFFSVAKTEEDEPVVEKPQVESASPLSISIPQTNDKTAQVVMEMMKGLLAEQTKRTEDITKAFMETVKAKPDNGSQPSGMVDMMKTMLEFMTKSQPQPQQQVNMMETIGSIFTLVKQMSDMNKPSANMTVNEQLNLEAVKLLMEQMKSTRQDPIELLKLGLELARSGEIPTPQEKEPTPVSDDGGFNLSRILSKGLERAVNSAASKIGDKVADQAGALMGGPAPQMALPPPARLPAQQPQQVQQRRPANLMQRPPQPTAPAPDTISIPSPEAIQKQIYALVQDLESPKAPEQIADEVLPKLHPMIIEQFKNSFADTMESFMPMMPPELQEVVKRNQAKILAVYNAIQAKIK